MNGTSSIDIAFIDKIAFPGEKGKSIYESDLFNVLSVEFSESIDPSYFEKVKIIVSRYTVVDKNLLDKFPNLEYVILASVTYRWVDLEYCEKKNIIVSNCPTYNTDATAQFAVGMLYDFALNQKREESKKLIKNGKWNLGGYEFIGFSQKKVAIFGKGNIGSKIITTLKSFNMDLTIFDSSSLDEEIEEVLPFMDFIFLAVPYNKRTIKLINEKRIQLLKKSCVIISIAPGEVIDEDALIKALKNKDIGGACLDSFCGEPFAMPSKNLMILSNLDNVNVTPHMAWNSDQSKHYLADELLAVIKSCCKNKPINVISNN